MVARRYKREQGDDGSIESDRRLFLIIARQWDLRIMVDLLIGPAQLYARLLAQYAQRQSNGKLTWEQFFAFLPDWKAVDLEAQSASAESVVRTFRRSLLDWGARWHLDADWCRDRAISTIRLWGHSKPAQLYLCWDGLDLWSLVKERLKIIDKLDPDEREFVRALEANPSAFSMRVDPPAVRKEPPTREALFPFESDPRAPKPPANLPRPLFPIESRDHYIDRVRETLQRDSSFVSRTAQRRLINKTLRGPVARFLDQFERYSRRRGWKRERSKQEHPKHLMWTALHQILGIEHCRIAAGSPTVSIDTVSQTISRTLKRIGLRNRKGRGRRPGRGRKQNKSLG